MAKPTKAKALERLQASLSEIPDLRPLNTGSPTFKKWQRNTEIAVTNTFGNNTRHLPDFTSVSFYVMAFPASQSDISETYLDGLASAASVLESMIEEIREYWPDDDQHTAPAPKEPAQVASSCEAFLIHGRDDSTRQAVARFLAKKWSSNPFCSPSSSSQGLTIIEKFEKYAHVKFATGRGGFALLTPDDTGALEGELQRHRARQNVIFELGATS